MSMRFSLHSVHGGVKDINEIYDRAQRAEALGFEGIFLRWPIPRGEQSPG